MKIRVATKQGIKSQLIEVGALNVASGLDIYDDVGSRSPSIDDGKLGLRVVEKDDATRGVVRVENDGVSLNKR